MKAYTIRSHNGKEEYSVILSFDDNGNINPEKSSCTCAHGSMYRFTKENIKKGKWKCRHVEKAIERHMMNIPDEIEIKRMEVYNENRKSICPIFQ